MLGDAVGPFKWVIAAGQVIFTSLFVWRVLRSILAARSPRFKAAIPGLWGVILIALIPVCFVGGSLGVWAGVILLDDILGLLPSEAGESLFGVVLIPFVGMFAVLVPATVISLLIAPAAVLLTKSVAPVSGIDARTLAERRALMAAVSGAIFVVGWMVVRLLFGPNP